MKWPAELNYEGAKFNPRNFSGAFDMEQSISKTILVLVRAVLGVALVRRSLCGPRVRKAPSIQI